MTDFLFGIAGIGGGLFLALLIVVCVILVFWGLMFASILYRKPGNRSMPPVSLPKEQPMLKATHDSVQDLARTIRQDSSTTLRVAHLLSAIISTINGFAGRESVAEFKHGVLDFTQTLAAEADALVLAVVDGKLPVSTKLPVPATPTLQSEPESD